jgi:hypothetical protein
MMRWPRALHWFVSVCTCHRRCGVWARCFDDFDPGSPLHRAEVPAAADPGPRSCPLAIVIMTLVLVLRGSSLVAVASEIIHLMKMRWANWRRPCIFDGPCRWGNGTGRKRGRRVVWPGDDVGHLRMVARPGRSRRRSGREWEGAAGKMFRAGVGGGAGLGRWCSARW